MKTMPTPSPAIAPSSSDSVDSEMLGGVENGVPEGSLLAALDLGSNSFHLIVARVEHGEIRPVETLAEKVQLGAGLIDHQLSSEAIDRGLACLERFAQLLDRLEPTRVRVVGTNALRQARNRRDFTKPAERLLGVPVDVVYGREEARLVYLGVAHSLADDESSRLVVDIGGGSTEFIVGQRFEPQRLVSLQMGCVSYAQRHFPDGKISDKAFRSAVSEAFAEASRIAPDFHSSNWIEAVGSSGTLQAVELLIQSQGWRDHGIDERSLNKLRKKLLSFAQTDEIDLPGLAENRRGVICAGVAITQGLFKALGIKKMRTSSGALREGVIYDLMGRLSHEDVRERSINAMVARHGPDPRSSDIVAHRTAVLATAVADSWQLSAQDVELLTWTAKVHEIGISIAQKSYHRHSAYLILNSDMPGFSQGEQELMALLLEGQRGKLRSEFLSAIPEDHFEKITRLIALLRLAIALKYVELFEKLQDISVSANGKTLTLILPRGWRRSHPLSSRELDELKALLPRLKIRLRITVVR